MRYTKIKIDWNDDAEKAFIELRTILSSEPFLVLPDLNKPFFLETDASDFAIGAVLCQEVEKEKRVIAYFSKSLTATQRNYSTSEKEMLAMVLAIEHFHQYLFGKRFTVYTDHQPLSGASSNSRASARLLRWFIRLGSYEFDVVYKTGKTNVVADLTSRWH